MPRILVTEEIADSGLDRLRDAGHDVDIRLGLSPDELIAAVPGAHALIIRSATQVTAAVLEAGSDLVVVGRAGLGVDNIDVEEATRRGVIVANAPQTNSLSTAEHAIALLLSLARNVPQAHGALTSGRWEKSRWEGVELYGKTFGVLGLGRIGTLVAQRGHAFGMRLIAWDPWTTSDRARTLGIELVELDELFARADFVSVHLLKTKESVGLIGKDLLAKAKPGIRIVNAARGGIIDEDALAEALHNGTVAGAALDVFATEPTTESPLFGLPQVVVTPHLGASTAEAQDKAGVTIAEQVGLALAGEFVTFAVNVAAGEAAESVRPFVPLAERLGQLYVSLNEGLPNVLEIECSGQIADYDNRILTLSVLKGVLGRVSDEPVTFVNAPRLAGDRGMEVRDTSTATAHDYVNLMTVRGGGHAIGGTLVGMRGEPRIVHIDGHTVDIPPANHMVVARNEDRPGVLLGVLQVVADAAINVDDMHLGRSPEGAASLIVMATTTPVGLDVLDRIRASDGIHEVHAVAT